MSHDRYLVDTIKKNFAAYSSAQLQDIAQSTDAEGWSAEARVAAREILQDRGERPPQEPTIAREPKPLPPPASDPLSLAWLFGLVVLPLLTGVMIIPRRRPEIEDPVALDQPVPFGFKVAWLALDTTDTDGVATALGLRDIREATWTEGIAAAYQSSIFVTPPVADWTLAVGTALFPPDRTEAFVKPLLERLSRQFGDAQYFCTHPDFELHVWARARKGRLVRGYGWLGAKGLTLWDEGAPTKDERDLGFSFFDEPTTAVQPAPNNRRAAPDENCVMELASVWSVDPTALDAHFKEPVLGLLGSLGRDENRIARGGA
jgi:hypothetical protein